MWSFSFVWLLCYLHQEDAPVYVAGATHKFRHFVCESTFVRFENFKLVQCCAKQKQS
jgi:hypothetical protein